MEEKLKEISMKRDMMSKAVKSVRRKPREEGRADLVNVKLPSVMYKRVKEEAEAQCSSVQGLLQRIVAQWFQALEVSSADEVFALHKKLNETKVKLLLATRARLESDPKLVMEYASYQMDQKNKAIAATLRPRVEETEVAKGLTDVQWKK
jgi:hypothetical protein